jgi:hypothetical protein
MSHTGRGIPSPNRRDQHVVIETHKRTLPYGAPAPQNEPPLSEPWHPAPPPPVPPPPVVDDPSPRVASPYRVEQRRLLMPAAGIGQEVVNLRRLMQDLTRALGSLERRIEKLERRR